jgi:hypothetical protein
VTKAKACLLGKVVSFNGLQTMKSTWSFILISVHMLDENNTTRMFLVVCEVHGPGSIFNLIGFQSLKEVFKIGGFINIKNYFRNHIKRQIHWGTMVCFYQTKEKFKTETKGKGIKNQTTLTCEHTTWSFELDWVFIIPLQRRHEFMLYLYSYFTSCLAFSY